MKNPSTLLVLGLIFAGSSLLAAPDLSKLPAAADKKDLTYAKDIRPLFEASCFRCHGQQRPRHNLRLDSLESVLKGSEDGKVVLPGKSTESLLLIAVAQLDDKTAMPPKRNPGGGRGGRGGPGQGGPGGGSRGGGDQGGPAPGNVGTPGNQGGSSGDNPQARRNGGPGSPGGQQ